MERLPNNLPIALFSIRELLNHLGESDRGPIFNEKMLAAREGYEALVSVFSNYEQSTT